MIAKEPLTSIEAAARVSSQQRRWWDQFFLWFCRVTATLSVIVLIFLLGSILVQGVPELRPHLVVNNNSADPEKAGLRPAIWGTIWTCLLCALFSLPIGVGTAIFLEEYIPKNPILRALHGLVRLNISNLAGVPSVVYGIMALTAFVGMFGFFHDRPWELGVTYYDQFFTEEESVVYVAVDGSDAPATQLNADLRFLDENYRPTEVTIIPAKGRVPRDLEEGVHVLRENSEPGRFRDERWYYIRLPLGKGMLTGGLTLMLVVLPIVIISSQEAIRSVPSSLREGALGLGATPLQVVWNVTLPSAVPGIMTGSILAMSRAIGEAAPILIVGGAAFLSRSPNNLMADYTVMPLQIYTWTSYPNKAFNLLAAAGIIILLAILLTFNALAVYIRYRAQRKLS